MRTMNKNRRVRRQSGTRPGSYFYFISFKEVTCELRTEWGNRESLGVVWGRVCQTGNSKCQDPSGEASLRPRIAARTSMEEASSGWIMQGLVGLSKLLGFYSEAMGIVGVFSKGELSDLISHIQSKLQLLRFSFFTVYLFHPWEKEKERP